MLDHVLEICIFEQKLICGSVGRKYRSLESAKIVNKHLNTEKVGSKVCVQRMLVEHSTMAQGYIVIHYVSSVTVVFSSEDKAFQVYVLI